MVQIVNVLNAMAFDYGNRKIFNQCTKKSGRYGLSVDIRKEF